MGGTRALVILKDGTAYINGAAAAHTFLAALVPTLGRPRDPVPDDEDPDIEFDLMRTFKKKIKAIASEVGDQICLTAAIGRPCESGGDAYRAARCEAPRLANGVRRSARASGRAKHDMSDVIHRAPVMSGIEEHTKHMEAKIDQTLELIQSLTTKIEDKMLPDDISNADTALSASVSGLAPPPSKVGQYGWW